ncbi:MAG: M20/M25/M40 family metallo-hydrolase [Anaerolineae bacterium]|jgi:aminopeptidase YwaD|nr:M20/M25/M40 family metallo-hydrolase [Anaerolineae bacterium]MBT7189581.1 M20/M25/M40 family metallo-hydrolase [Anaerolineae bacterium]MBT7992064.1 M20/M25/M40 family metallo-hydrolase [Anaerolineae bacterium]
MTNPHLPLDQKILGDIYSSREAMDNLEVLCDDFGSRFGGTAGEKLAADFIATKYKEYGLSNIHLEPFEYLGWERGDVKLEIISPVQKEIPCITLPQSPPIENFEGEIFNIGEGAPSDFNAKAAQIKGKFLMTNSALYPKGIKRWVHRSEKYGRSLLAGAIGFIFVNHYPGYGPATGGIGWEGEAALAPGISIAKEDGDFIQRLLKKHGSVKIRLTSTDTISPKISWNIVGDLPGTEKPDEIILMGSHYDGHDISQGASDPASGVVSVLEAARVLGKHVKLPRTIRFVMWGVEEIGLLGSNAYVRDHADDLHKIRFYLNMDAAGGAPSKDINLHAWDVLQETFEGYREEMALDFAIGQTFHSASDHFPFLKAGVITGGVEPVRQTRSGRGYGHTQFDTVDKVEIQGLRDAASLAARIVLRVAHEKNWPATPRDTSAVDELLNQPSRTEVQAYLAKMEEYHSQN